jgi:hypothetical protein
MANRTLIYINDQAVDLAPNTVVASTFKALEIGDMRTRNANYTNQFKLPKTPGNRRILEFVDSELSNSTAPYVKLPAKIVQNGIEIVGSGVAVITSVDSNFNVAIYSGTFDFFDLLTGLNIDSLDFGNGLITWDNTQLELSRGNSTEVEADHKNLSSAFYDRVNYDWSTATYFAMSNETSYPSVRYAAIIKNIITNAGYTYSGSVFTNSKFLKLVIPYSRPQFELSGSFITNRQFSATKTASQTVTNPGAGYDVVVFNNVVTQDGYGMYSASTGRYDCNVAYATDPRDYNFGLYAEITFTVTSGTYDFRIGTSNIDLPTIGSASYTAGTYTIQIGYDEPDVLQTLMHGADKFYEIRCRRIVSGSCTITSGKFYNKVYGSNRNPISPVFSQNEILPTISRKDFFKDFAIRFGLLFKQSNNVLICKTINEVIADKANAVDWTSKRDNKTNDITYNLNGYAQKNYLAYPANDDFYDDTHDKGVISVNNVNIDLTSDYHTSIFNGSITTAITNGSSDQISCLKIPFFSTPPTSPDYMTKFDNDPGYRIALTKQIPASPFSVVFGTNLFTDFSVLYFSDPSTSDQMNWQESIDSNYDQLIASLDKTKVVTRYYRLNELDIASLDMLRLVYDSGAYYLINTVSNFIPGISTKVELFKVV